MSILHYLQLLYEHLLIFIKIFINIYVDHVFLNMIANRYSERYWFYFSDNYDGFNYMRTNYEEELLWAIIERKKNYACNHIINNYICLWNNEYDTQGSF